MFDRSKNIITFSVIFLILDVLFALMVGLSDIDRTSAQKTLIVCAIIAFPLLTAVIWQSIYILRLRKFLAELPEEPEHYFRKSSYKMKERFYWFSDYFLDLRKLRKVRYEKIRSITVTTASVGIGSIRCGPLRSRPLIPFAGWYRLRISCGFRSTVITINDSDRLCRSIIKQFKKKNNNISVYNEP